MIIRRNITTLLILLLLVLVSCGGNKPTASTKLSPEEFELKLKDITNENLVDVRTPEEYELGHIINALNINIQDTDFEKQISELDREKPIFVHCAAGAPGGRSDKTCKLLGELGFKEIYELEGGFVGWTNAGKEIDK